MKNSTQLKRCKFFFLIIIASFTPAIIKSQDSIPTWDKKELYSYCIEYDIMNHPTKGNWIVSWGLPKELLKHALNNEGLEFTETDSSIIFKQDYITHHECMFDKMNTLYLVKSFHLMTVNFGVDYSKKLKRKLTIVFGKAPMTTPYDFNGIVYSWFNNKCFSGSGSTLVNYIDQSGLYYIYHSVYRYK